MKKIRDLYRGDGGPLNDYNQGWNDGTDAAAEVFSAENAALRAEVEKCQDYMRTQFADRRDAERYRWLSERTDCSFGLATFQLDVPHPSITLDAAIDAARKESA